MTNQPKYNLEPDPKYLFWGALILIAVISSLVLIIHSIRP